MLRKTIFNLLANAMLGAVLMASNVAVALPGPPPGLGAGGPPPGAGLGGPRPGPSAGGFSPGLGRGGPRYGGARGLEGRSADSYGRYGYGNDDHGSYSRDDRRYREWRYPYGVDVYSDSYGSNGCSYIYSARRHRPVVVCDEY